MAFNDLQFITGNATAIDYGSTTCHDISFTRCLVFAGPGSSAVLMTTAANVAQNWTFDSCIFVSLGAAAVSLTLTRPTTADFDYAITFKNCYVTAWGGNGIGITATGANTFKGGGVKVLGCTVHSGTTSAIAVNSANVSTTIPGAVVYSCILLSQGSGTCIAANTSGQITENYNIINGSRTNVSAGANSNLVGTSYFLGLEWGQSFIQHFAPRPYLSPIEGSNALNFGFQTGNPTTDALGAPRSQNTSGAMMAAGAFELVNAASSATSPVDTGSNSLKIAGFGYEDFDLPVSAGAQTITVKCQFDGSYGGSTYPQFVIIDDTGATVNTTNFTVSASGAWESQTSPSFNPSAAKMYRLRLIVQSTAVAGNTYFDSVITMSQPGTVGFEVLIKGKPFGTLMPSSLAARGIRVGGRL